MIPNFSINPYVKPYTGGISSEYGQSVQQRLAQYNQVAEADDVLGYQADTLYNNIGPFDNDKIIAGQLLNKVRTELSDRAKKGDYENMFREVKRSARNFAAQTQPLLQNKALYDKYRATLKDKLDKGEIGVDTYNKSILKSTVDYKGYNPSNPDSYFKGYTPSNDLSIADKLNKFFGDTFKGDKVVYDIINPITGLKEKVTKETNELPVKYGNKNLYFDDTTNSYNLEGNGRKISQIELAARQYIQGDKDIQNYSQNQLNLGNAQRVLSEMNGAIQAETQKLGYSINMNEKEALPATWLQRYDDQIDINKPFNSASEVPSENIHINPKFTEYTFSPNGKLAKSSEYLLSNSDGTYSKFFDKNGKQLSVKEYNRLNNLAFVGDDPELFRSIRVEKATPEEQAQLDKVNNEQFDDLVKDTFLARQGFANLNQSQKESYLNIHKGQWNTPNFRKQVLEDYNQSIKNFKTVENQLWLQRNYSSIREINDIDVPKESKGEDGNNILARNLQGRTINVLSADKDLNINTEGIKDVNTLLSKMEEEGYYFKGMTSNGLLKINPKSNNPGSSVTMQFKDDKNQKVKYIQAAVDINDADKKPLLKLGQQVGQAYLSGNGGFVNIPGLGKAGFKVINVPSQVVQPGTPSFFGLVQEVDSNGNNVGQPTPIIDWLDEFINKPAVKSEAKSFLINK